MSELDTGTVAGWRRSLLLNSDVPLRAALCATFVAHGYAKIFDGGVGGLTGLLQSKGLPAPEALAWLTAVWEFGGGIAVGLGLFTRLAALGLAIVMAVAITQVHLSQGFVMNKGAGYEWQFALFCIALALVMRGAGPISADYILRSSKKAEAPPASS